MKTKLHILIPIIALAIGADAFAGRLKLPKLPSLRRVASDLTAPFEALGKGAETLVGNAAHALEQTAHVAGDALEGIGQAPGNIAEGLAQVPTQTGRLVEEMGDDLKTSAEKVGNITCNIITLGGCSRERDKEKAKNAEAIAQAHNQSAEELRLSQISHLNEMLANNNADLLKAKNILGNLVIVQKLLESNLKFIDKLYAMAEADKFKDQTLLTMIADQNKLLFETFQNFSENLDENSKEIDAFKDITQMIESYSDYVEAIPSWSNESRPEELYDQTVAIGFKALKLITSVTTGLDESIEYLSKEIVDQKKEIKKLAKK